MHTHNHHILTRPRAFDVICQAHRDQEDIHTHAHAHVHVHACVRDGDTLGCGCVGEGLGCGTVCKYGEEAGATSPGPYAEIRAGAWRRMDCEVHGSVRERENMYAKVVQNTLSRHKRRKRGPNKRNKPSTGTGPGANGPSPIEDRDPDPDEKLVSVSDMEWETEQGYAGWSPEVRKGQHTDTDYVRRGGLLTLMINALANEPVDSTYRFWMSCCVETYLRGSDPVNQLFVLRTGILEHLLVQTLRHEVGRFTQGTFDLMSELIKFNPICFLELERLLTANAIRFRAILDLASENLVDSNVFLRAIMITVDACAAQGKAPVCVCTRNVGKCAEEKARQRASESYDDAQTLRSRVGGRKQVGDCVGRRKSIGLPTQYTSKEGSGHEAHPPYRHQDSQHAQDMHKQGAETHTENVGEFKEDIQRVPQVHEHNHKHNSGANDQAECVGGFEGGQSCRLGEWAQEAADTQLAHYFSRPTQRLKILQMMVTAVSSASITNDNICCVNTSMIIFILEVRRGRLMRLIQGLVKHDRNNYNAKGSFIQRLIELVTFWHAYYKDREKEKKSLEMSSRVQVGEWLYVAQLLIGDEGTGGLLHDAAGIPIDQA
ncbi:hypothetical protein SARC_01646 [Sphaeroforma arctica JP610]|uniref:Uncharacterized protein n=1 Tax=Sphaeroforma arctica JP610 TaxID=667725 RepID=A0A0L0GBC9_9EUKA|nr:hypothetical protein SARC_01646 [Sphaeroforma arctica JP610]KNC86209.1 hypothetical protein SARC_01646 [Sphaeroforma arctica JP610]|eukprot:XP_014160111.1 hypothetical protein SARC_01646 [Sphaeroforma arctica JP610]